jgi:hypothetical protein
MKFYQGVILFFAVLLLAAAFSGFLTDYETPQYHGSDAVAREIPQP